MAIYLMILTAFYSMFLSADNGKTANMYFLYVGAYTQGDDQGIGVFTFHPTDGDLKYVTTIKGVKNPSYLAIHPKKKILVAANEIGDFQGEKSGAVSVFSINSQTGDLRLLNQVASMGSSPCYVSVDKAAKNVLVANYGGGNVALLPLTNEGKLGKSASVIQHAGSGPITSRQQGPHAHCIQYDRKGNFALAVDLGIDKVISYQVDEGKQTLKSVSEFTTAPGAGPRHITFHPKNHLAFIINELNSTITSCTYDSKSGVLNEVVTVSSLPEGFSENNSCADIHVSPNGKFLYGSNRGHDSIVVYAIDSQTGNLSYVSHHSVKGNTPRNFMIDPTGKFLLVANQNSDNIVVFKIDPETGRLSGNGVQVQFPKPVCLKMVAAQ